MTRSKNPCFEYQEKIPTIAKNATEVDKLKARIKDLEAENEDLKRKFAISSPQ